MSNFHFKDKSLSLKAKGLLSLILSLPEDWNYTTRGLAAICKEGIDSIGTALKELESTGYIKRNQLRDEKGKITDTEYIIYEKPQENPKTAEPHAETPHTENPYMDIPSTENTAQLNTNKSNKKELNTDLSNTYPIKSYQKECNAEQTAVFTKEQSNRSGYDEAETYRQIIKENIEYDILNLRNERDIAMLDEIVDLMTETVCTQKSSLVIAGDTFPSAIVKSKLLKLNNS